MPRSHGVPTEARRAARRAVHAAAVFTWAVPAVAIGCTLGGAAIVLLLSDTPGLGLLTGIALAQLLAGPAATILHGRVATPARAASVELCPAEEPALAALVRATADALRLPAPDAIAVSLDTRVLLRRDSGRSVLVVGASWLAAATAVQTGVAVAHALLEAQIARGTSRLRRVDERLARARLVLAGPRGGKLWSGYARAGERLANRAAAARLRAIDAACVRAFGSDALIDAVQAQRLQSAFAEYWAEDVGSCLIAGFAPPLLDGWRRVLEQAQLASCDASDEPLAPSSPERRVSLRTPESVLERRLLAASYPDRAGELVEIAWSAVPHAVVLPRLRGSIAPYADPWLHAVTAATLVQALEQPPPELKPQAWVALIADALALALADIGWALQAPSGAFVELRDGVHSVVPQLLCNALASGDGDAAAHWDALLEDTEIGELRLTEVEALSQIPLGYSRTVVPPAPPVRLALARAPRALLRAAGVLAVVGVPGLAVTISLGVAATMTPALRGRVALVCFGLALAGGLASWATSRLRLLLCRDALIVEAECVRIEAPGLLKRPFEIPRAVVRAVMIDARDRVPRRRFPMGPSEQVVPGALDESSAIGWLWAEDAPSVVPLLDVAAQAPTLALLFSAPLVAPSARRTATGPLRGEAMTGLLLCVTDPAAARTAFGPWDLTRTGSYADAEHVLTGFLGRPPTDGEGACDA